MWMPFESKQVVSSIVEQFKKKLIKIEIKCVSDITEETNENVLTFQYPEARRDESVVENLHGIEVKICLP